MLHHKVRAQSSLGSRSCPYMLDLGFFFFLLCCLLASNLLEISVDGAVCLQFWVVVFGKEERET